MICNSLKPGSFDSWHCQPYPIEFDISHYVKFGDFTTDIQLGKAVYYNPQFTFLDGWALKVDSWIFHAECTFTQDKETGDRLSAFKVVGYHYKHPSDPRPVTRIRMKNAYIIQQPGNLTVTFMVKIILLTIADKVIPKKYPHLKNYREMEVSLNPWENTVVIL